MNQALLEAIAPMLNAEVRNYIAPGLSSFLVGGETHGRMRLFRSTRDQREYITPHSHRYNFTCLVLAGEVVNTLYSQVTYEGGDTHAFCSGRLKRSVEKIGKYVFEPGGGRSYWRETSTKFAAGETYAMEWKDVHTIRFNKGARVLFFEGPPLVDYSTVLEPWEFGKRVPTFVTQPWMFEQVGS